MANHCLVCGNQKSGKKYLLAKLIRDVEFQHTSKAHSECVWSITNKYYCSDVTLTILHSKDALTDNNDIDESCTKLSSRQFSAILLVLNLNEPQNVVEKELNEWVDALSPYLSSSECSLLLGNYVSPYSRLDDGSLDSHRQSKQKEFHQYLHSWSVDNCFEFVPSPYLHTETDEKMNTDNFYAPSSPLFASYDSMELGHSRISSALQCVMWPNLTRNPPKQARPKLASNTPIQPLLSGANNDNEEQSTNENQRDEHQKQQQSANQTESNQEQPLQQELKEEDKFRKHDRVKLFGLQSKQHWNGKIAEIVGPFSRTKRRWPVELKEDESTNEIKKALIQTKNLVLEKKGPRWNEQTEQKETHKIITDGGSEVAKHENGRSEESKNEEEMPEDVGDRVLENKMSSFQALIDEMQQVRSDAKSGKLTDQERRDRAAETAMKLMSYMGLDEEGLNEQSD
mmetsp:Transcript_20632/g.32850  ORF Transcript_20632/g.32850 Transcript_20632/m.32850 type:complete len:455 (-) Transcript_20632:69-1433(-)